jgi:hypothetical protein
MSSMLATGLSDLNSRFNCLYCLSCLNNEDLAMIDDTEKPAETVAPLPNTGAANAKPKAAASAATRKPRAAAKSAAAKPAAKRPAAAGKIVRRPVVGSKPAAASKSVQAAKPVAPKKAGKPAKSKKVKLVRDSFTMPEDEYAVIALLKKRCLAAGVSAKKSEILRAAVASLARLSDDSVTASIRRLAVIKTGRPAKGSK